MKISEWQKIVDDWITTVGVRYFDEKTNMLVLMEEVGELSRLMAREYGEQSHKKSVTKESAQAAIRDELGDVIFVLTCLANQMGVDLTQVLADNMKKKDGRDQNRHRNNSKLHS